tara:strand:+ start:3861 stop:5564 length:1704 start_codon:yes stop_codon:yes gene_type:complete
MARKGYLGNPKLKAVGEQVAFTKDNIIEWKKCRDDVIYFMTNYVKVIDDGKLVALVPRAYQEKMVSVFQKNRFSINMLPRQAGKSTIVVAFMLHEILFKKYQRIAILANKEKLARDLLAKIKLAYIHLPKWLQQAIADGGWNKSYIELENGCIIDAAATSSDTIRGGTYNLVFLDEFAHVDLNMQEDFFNSVYPTIEASKTSKIIIVSTPKGMNLFYKLWNEAVDGKNDYVPTAVHWSEVPGRDEAWKKQTIRNTSEQQFRQEQDCEFIGSTHTLIHPTKLQNMTYKTPISQWQDVDIYAQPVPGFYYAIGVDVSSGGGLDHQAFTVIDITEMPYKLVAKYYNKDMSPLLYPQLIYSVGKAYNEAFVLVENNDIGLTVAHALHNDFEYENTLMSSFHGRNGQRLGSGFSGTKSQIGVKMTPQVKRIGCSNLKDLIEKDKLIVEDWEILQELYSFVADGKKSFSAEEGRYDDLVMSLVSFAWMTGQPYFRDMTDVNIRDKLFAQQMEMMEAYMTPFGIIDDGQLDEETVIIDEKGNKWHVDQQGDDTFGGGWSDGINYDTEDQIDYDW